MSEDDPERDETDVDEGPADDQAEDRDGSSVDDQPEEVDDRAADDQSQDGNESPADKRSEDGGPEEPVEDEPGDALLPDSVRIALTAVLTIAVLVALVGVVYVGLTPQQETDPYTEFYILGPGGEASDYPTELLTGQEANITVGIVNSEQRDVTYTVVVVADNETLTTETATVVNGETWEQPVRYSIDEPGPREVRFLLYRSPDPDFSEDPYQTLRLQTNVTAPS